MIDWMSRLLDKHTRLTVYRKLSRDWSTCAIGEAYEKFPTAVEVASFGEPIPRDKTLARLGLAFHHAVYSNRRTQAKRLYASIQRRVTFLIGKMLV